MIEGHPHLPELSEEQLLESMGPQRLVDHILELGSRASHLETKMNLAATVLEGAYGVSVEDILKQREQNGKT